MVSIGIVIRYVLLNFDLYVVLGKSSLFELFNWNGELNFYDLEIGEGSLSSWWIEDCVVMLFWKIKFNIEKFFFLEDKLYNGVLGFLVIYFEDIVSGEKIYIGEFNWG